jgi:hypothetical protein
LAKKYWFAALSEIEKNPPPRSDMFLSVKLSALEQGLMNLYPKDWSKEKVDSQDVMKLRQEQVNILARIARVNDKFVPHNDLLYTKSQERYDNARNEYEKAVASANLQAQKQQQPSSSGGESK